MEQTRVLLGRLSRRTQTMRRKESSSRLHDSRGRKTFLTRSESSLSYLQTEVTGYISLTSKYLLSSYYELGALIRPGDRTINNSDQNLYIYGAHGLFGDTNNNNR